MSDVTCVVGRFADSSDAEEALEALCQAGFERNHIDLEVGVENVVVVTQSNQKGAGALKGILEFFQVKTRYDPYSKETAHHDSYRTAGQPCHGGYAHELENAAGKEVKAATLRVNTHQRHAEVIAIMTAYCGECNGDTGVPST